MIKRSVDIVSALAGLIVLSPVLVAAGVAIRLDSEGPVLFKQDRIGRGFERFSILKFRTMTTRTAGAGPDITVGDDARITRVGRFLRRMKIDELPQLINVLRGEMSLVGPRPELPRIVELFREDYAEVLRVRPGMTDFASLKYRDEAGILARSPAPDEEYLTEILPDKIRLAKEYVRQSSMALDLRLIGLTLCAIVRAEDPV